MDEGAALGGKLCDLGLEDRIWVQIFPVIQVPLMRLCKEGSVEMATSAYEVSLDINPKPLSPLRLTSTAQLPRIPTYGVSTLP